MAMLLNLHPNMKPLRIWHTRIINPETEGKIVAGTRSWATDRAEFRDPGWMLALFSDTRFAWLWLILRVYLGYNWLHAGLGKLSNPAWVTTGEGLKGFWSKAILTQPKPTIAFDWYRYFIEALLTGGHYTWFAKLIIAGEMLVGATLIIGAFTGIAAFFGGFMNFNFMICLLYTSDAADE